MPDIADTGRTPRPGASGRQVRSAAFVLTIRLAALFFAVLGSFGALVSVMHVREQRLAAGEGNFSAAVRSGQAIENALFLMRSNALSLLDMLDIAPASPRIVNEVLESFFERNQDIAALLVSSGREYSNSRFFLTHELDSDLAASFLGAHEEEVARGKAGQSLLLNAAPVFGIPVLVYLFPWQGEGIPEAGALFFSPQHLSFNIENGAGAGFMVSGGGALLYGDEGPGGQGFLEPDAAFVRALFEGNERKLQTLYTGGGKKYALAFFKFLASDAALIRVLPYDALYESAAAFARRIAFLAAALFCLSVLFVWIFSRNFVPRRAETTDAETAVPIDPKLAQDAGITGASKSAASNPAGEGVSAFFSVLTPPGSASETPGNALLCDTCLKYAASCVEKTSGRVDTRSGGVMRSVWKAGGPAEAAFSAVRGALTLRMSLAELNRTRKGLPGARMGCGIDTGSPDTASMAELFNGFFGTDILITENVLNLTGKYLVTEEVAPRIFAVVNVRASRPDRKQMRPSSLAELRRFLGTDSA
ncbi:MAG: hypothetical protein LBI85_07020, partial [Spirochaetaceae bacterium]|nr:hypothetical protein [Spirochaetaceae bacterium]